jgi:hypothetical protein
MRASGTLGIQDRGDMKKLLLPLVMLLTTMPAHAFTKEPVPYPPLGNMNQEDYFCGSVQFSIRPQEGWVVWKEKSAPSTLLQITGWRPYEWRFEFTDIWFGRIHFVWEGPYGGVLYKEKNKWYCLRDFDQKLDVTPGVTLDASGKASFQ